MDDIDLLMQGPAKGDCECGRDGCTLYGTLKRADRQGRRHVKGCTCPVCRGANNRRKGDSKAAKARKIIGLGGPASRHEEHWTGAVLSEMKAGAQVGPIATRFEAARAQSNASRAIGDNRPFVMVAMPDDTSDGIVLCRLSELRNVAYALVEMWESGTTPG
jgi:hypothetical protein